MTARINHSIYDMRADKVTLVSDETYLNPSQTCVIAEVPDDYTLYLPNACVAAGKDFIITTGTVASNKTLTIKDEDGNSVTTIAASSKWRIIKSNGLAYVLVATNIT